VKAKLQEIREVLVSNVRKVNSYALSDLPDTKCWPTASTSKPSQMAFAHTRTGTANRKDSPKSSAELFDHCNELHRVNSRDSELKFPSRTCEEEIIRVWPKFLAFT
jgi:hypothetical protein